jgi:hypothetical protein
MTWTVVCQNKKGHRLPQEAPTFELAWALASPGTLSQPPEPDGWVRMTKQQAELLFELGLTHVCVAAKNGEKRFIYYHGDQHHHHQESFRD